MNVAAVISLLAMHGTAVAEKTLVGISIDPGVVNEQHAGMFEPPADEAGQVEHRVACARGGQEVERIRCIGFHKPFDEFATYFVGFLSDQRLTTMKSVPSPVSSPRP